MNKRILGLLEDYCIEKGFEKWENDNELLEVLRNFDVIHKELCDSHRWWNEYQYVIRIKDTYIGYCNAETTGDMSASEVGYDFEPDSICEMEPIQKTITTYIVKKGVVF